MTINDHFLITKFWTGDYDARWILINAFIIVLRAHQVRCRLLSAQRKIKAYDQKVTSK